MTQVLKMNSTDEVTLTAHFMEWRRQNQTFIDLAGYTYQTHNLTGLDEPMQVRTAKVSASLLPLLGVQPVLGRRDRGQTGEPALCGGAGAPFGPAEADIRVQ